MDVPRKYTRSCVGRPIPTYWRSYNAHLSGSMFPSVLSSSVFEDGGGLRREKSPRGTRR